MTTTTDKWTCREIASLLEAHGVRHAVISPGSRNSAIIMALARTTSIRCHTVIDERSAAFSALGMASTSDSPVAIVCTSGTALLNYAPAVAEAYYRRLPLIVISADRHEAWIDQDDSQTMRQPGALSNFVVKSYSFPGNPADDDSRWKINRELNEGLLIATGRCKGPVHFNISLGEPLTQTADVTEHTPRVIGRIGSEGDISTVTARKLAAGLSGKKVLIVVGFNRPDSKLNRALQRLAQFESIAIVAEKTANLHSRQFVNNVDNALLAAPVTDILRPDIIISTGGSLVSRRLKELIRSWNVPHWRIGGDETIIDCFQSLTLSVDADQTLFFQRLASAMQPYRSKSDYAQTWRQIQETAEKATLTFNGRWSDLTAIHHIISSMPKGVNLQVSNGMTLRHVLSAPVVDLHRFDCNRGVSGIDGSTSTAVGAAMLYDGQTILVSGDMSAQYDVSALSSQLMTDRFKMIVICNGDGGIFRVIKTTRDLPELDRYLASEVNFPAGELARAYGFEFFEANDMKSLKQSLPVFLSVRKKAMLAVHTDSETSAEVTFEFYKHLKTQ